MFPQRRVVVPGGCPPIITGKRNSCRDIFAPADILFGASVLVLVFGSVMIIVGGALTHLNKGLTAHLSITYVGIAIFLAGFTTCAIAVSRIVSTNRRLKEMGLTTREFVNQWSQEELMVQLTGAQQKPSHEPNPSSDHD